MRCVIGIYKIVHRETGRVYVGQSLNVHRRLTDHARGKGRHYISLAVAKHGWAAFDAEILEACSKESLNAIEAKWIAHFNCMAPLGFNLTSGGGARTFVSEETRKRIADGSRGRKQSDETILKRKQSRAANPDARGWKFSAEAIDKRNATRRANAIPQVWTDERRAAKSAQMLGKKHSEETRRNQSARMTGARRSDEARAAISAGLLGRTFSKTHCENIALAVRSRGDEWKKKISETKRRKRLELANAFAAERLVTS